MARRPVFTPLSEPPFFEATEVEFHFFPGFAMVQKRRNIEALQQGFLEEHPDARILEISTKSPQPLGVALSPFNLQVHHEGETFHVESAFQSSKRFEDSGPYPSCCTPLPAKLGARFVPKKQAPQPATSISESPSPPLPQPISTTGCTSQRSPRTRTSLSPC